MEVGLSGSYRRSNLDQENFTDTKSITGSMTYYFYALSAVELSYTKGLTTVQTDPSLVTGQTAKTEFELIGIDLILSLGEKESLVKPYFKLGAVHVQSKIIIQNSFATDTIEPESGVAPSAGVGVKLALSKQLSVKLGLDCWTSPLSQKPVEFNYAARSGISWLF